MSQPLLSAAAIAVATLLVATDVAAQRVPERAGAAATQRRTARFYGVVVDAVTRQPLGGALLASPSVAGVTTTDSAGRFDISGINPGIVRFFVAKEGYPRANFTVAFAAGEVMERTLELDSTVVEVDRSNATPQALPAVTVEATEPIPRWLRDFERRRQSGRGQYVTRDEIEKRNYNRLSDAVRVMRGVTLDCGGGGSACVIRMARAPMRCYPEYWIDGQLNNSWGPLVPVRDIEALEVYTGPTDTPGEFAGRNSGCGTIVIWTSAGLRSRNPDP